MHRNLRKCSNLLFGVHCISLAVSQKVKMLASIAQPRVQSRKNVWH